MQVVDHRAAQARPGTSIVVLGYDGLNLTVACVESVLRATQDFEIVLVDNGSRDATWEYAQSMAERHPDLFVAARLDKNAGFPGGANAGIMLTRGRHVCFLNNDTRVSDTWLWRLLAILEANPEFGAVGAMLTMAGGTAQELRVLEAELPRDLGRADRVAYARNLGKLTRVPKLVANGLVVSRQAMVAVGGFDLRYGEGNFEDDDLCVRITLAGLIILMVQNVLLYHRGHATFDEHKTDVGKLLHRSWSIFKEKWDLPPDLPYGNTPFDQVTARPRPDAVYYPPIWEWSEQAMRTCVDRLRAGGDAERAAMAEAFGRQHFGVRL